MNGLSYSEDRWYYTLKESFLEKFQDVPATADLSPNRKNILELLIGLSIINVDSITEVRSSAFQKHVKPTREKFNSKDRVLKATILMLRDSIYH